MWGVPVLIYAEPAIALRLYRQLKTMPERGLRPVGVLLHPDEYWARDLGQSGIPFHDVRNAVACAMTHRATWVLIGAATRDAPSDTDDTSSQSLWAIPNRILLSSPHVEVGMWDQTQTIGPACGIRLGGACPDSFRGAIKRLFDLSVAISILLLTIPFLAAIALLIRLSSSGGVLYGQQRLGKNGRPFTAWKFRTMRDNADALLQAYLESDAQYREEWDATRKLKRDPRVTVIGSFLRKSSLDELPQLWNVILGDMSMVGPRPIVDSPDYDGAYISDHPREFAIYKSVRPGLTGMWQISCRNHGVYKMRIYWDMYYIRNWSLWLDLYIVLRTVRTVLLREGAY
jgi:Undecaprenyl-phosphate galactose phosphotransferase WbaP